MFLGRCLVCLSFLSVYRCQARFGSASGLIHRLSQPTGGGWMQKIRLLLADDHPLVFQWLACLLIKGWTTTSIESARMHEKDNGVFF